MKKIFTVILLIAVLLVSSCAAEQEAVELEYDTGYTVDLTGLTFRLGSYWAEQFNPSDGFSSSTDKMLVRYKELKEAYGCDFIVLRWEDGSADILRDLAAGYDTIDLLDSHADAGGYALYKQGILACLEDIETIDISEDKWGALPFRQYGVFDGKSYGFYQWEWEYYPEYAGVILFNGELLSELGVSYPYELQEEGQWTWDNFRNMLLQCQSNADPSLELIPATAENIFFDVQAFMYSNGCHVVEQTSSGTYVYGLNKPEAVEAIEFLNGLHNDDLYIESGMGPFTGTQNAAFALCESYHGTHHIEGAAYAPTVMENYGMMPIPYGPSGNSEITSAFTHKHRRLNWVIGFSGNDIDNIGMVIDFVFEPLDDSGGWRENGERVLFHHTQDFDNYLSMLNNLQYNYSLQIQDTYSDMQVMFKNAVTGSKSASEAVSTIAAAIQAELDENMNK